MAKFSTTFSADAVLQYVCTAHKPRNLDAWRATFNIFGTFGSGTVTLFMSTDGGTTKVAMKTLNGTAYSTTAADNFNVELGSGNTLNSDILIYATLNGSTNPDLTITVHDNRD